eukprot:8944526-Alexandrium_andersonii.AAC.2
MHAAVQHARSGLKSLLHLALSWRAGPPGRSLRDRAACLSPRAGSSRPVSYTHLTLPTICSV